MLCFIGFVRSQDAHNRQMMKLVLSQQVCCMAECVFRRNGYQFGCHNFTNDHKTLCLRIPRAFQAGEEAGAPYLAVSPGTSRVFHRTSLIRRQSATLADWVSRLPVSLSCRLRCPSIVPPTYAFPHLGCLTSVPRLMPCESVPP